MLVLSIRVQVYVHKVFCTTLLSIHVNIRLCLDSAPRSECPTLFCPVIVHHDTTIYPNFALSTWLKNTCLHVFQLDHDI